MAAERFGPRRCFYLQVELDRKVEDYRKTRRLVDTSSAIRELLWKALDGLEAKPKQ